MGSKSGENGPKASNKGWFPWKTVTLILLLGVITMINIDIQKNKTFKASKTGLFLKDVGLFETAVTVGDYTTKTYTKSSKWIVKNVPVYYKNTKEFLTPYWKLVVKYANQAWKWVKKQTPVVLDKIEEYIPGSKAKLTMIGTEIGKVLVWLWDFLVDFTTFYFNLICDLSVKLFYALRDTISGKVSLKDVQKNVQVMGSNLSKFASETYKLASKQLKALTS